MTKSLDFPGGTVPMPDKTIAYRGSITDLATDVAFLLTPRQGIKLIQELTWFLDTCSEKFQGKIDASQEVEPKKQSLSAEEESAILRKLSVTVEALKFCGLAVRGTAVQEDQLAQVAIGHAIIWLRSLQK